LHKGHLVVVINPLCLKGGSPSKAKKVHKSITGGSKNSVKEVIIATSQCHSITFLFYYHWVLRKVRNPIWHRVIHFHAAEFYHAVRAACFVGRLVRSNVRLPMSCGDRFPMFIFVVVLKPKCGHVPL